MARNTGRFKNIKLGKNIHRQMKRRGPPQPYPRRQVTPPWQPGNTREPVTPPDVPEIAPPDEQVTGEEIPEVPSPLNGAPARPGGPCR